MLVVKKLTTDLLEKLTPISDASLVGEETLLRIGRSGFALSYTPLARAEWRSFPTQASAAPEAFCTGDSRALFAAFMDDVYVGCAAVSVLCDGWADLEDIRVDASKRRKGVARALLAACERYARKRGAYGLRLCTSDQNPGLCQFCEHCGFVLQGLDRMALILRADERLKPLPRRACALYFYLVFEKG